MYFITEREIEACLETQRRTLYMPDGLAKSFTGFKIMWEAYDKLINIYQIDPACLIKLTFSNMKEMGYCFDLAFPDMVAYVAGEYDKIYDP